MAASRLPPVDALLLDVDGVLIDSHGAFPEAVAAAARHFLRLAGAPAEAAPTPEATRLLKLAGGLNDEWDVAYVACLWALWSSRDERAPSLPEFVAECRARGGGREGARACLSARAGRRAVEIAREVDGGLPETLAMEYYGGEACPDLYGFPARHLDGRPGLWRRERPFVTPAELRPWAGRLGLYTGRTDRELEHALVRFGLGELFPPSVRVSASDGVVKPDPQGLRRLIEALAARRAVFVGDTVDDAATVRRFAEVGGRPEVEVGFVGVAPPGGELARRLYEEGALAVVAHLRELLAALPAPAPGLRGGP